MVVVVDDNNNEMPTGHKVPMFDLKGCPTYDGMFTTQTQVASCAGTLRTAAAFPSPTALSGSTCTKCPYAQTVTGVSKVYQGQSVSTTKINSVCIDGTAPTLTCPAGGQPATTGSYPDIKCHVCSHPVLTTDSDSRANYFSGQISFGQNQVGGTIAEGSISAYKVFLVDKDMNQLATAGQVSKNSSLSSTCCDENAYVVSISGLALPSGTVGMTVNPVDSSNVVIPLGRYANVVDVLPVTTTVTTTVTAGATSSPPQGSGPKDTYVAGTMGLSVSNATAFVADPNAKMAVKKGIANVLSVLEQRVSVTLTASRRLSELWDLLEAEVRRLSTSVTVNYEVLVPAGAPAADVTSVTDKLSNSSTSNLLTSAITTQVDQLIGSGLYNVTVASLPTPGVVVRLASTTTTPAGSSTGATTGGDGVAAGTPGLRQSPGVFMMILGVVAARSSASLL